MITLPDAESYGRDPTLERALCKRESKRVCACCAFGAFGGKFVIRPPWL